MYVIDISKRKLTLHKVTDLTTSLLVKAPISTSMVSTKLKSYSDK